jgi:2Fe-2S ferredoxin
MPTLIIVNRQGEEKAIEAQSGISLMEAIKDAGFDELMAMCGGGCACATCHVYLDSQTSAIPAPTQNEIELLETSLHFNEKSRLSCQVPVTDDISGLRVVIAPED